MLKQYERSLKQMEDQVSLAEQEFDVGRKAVSFLKGKLSALGGSKSLSASGSVSTSAGLSPPQTNVVEIPSSKEVIAQLRTAAQKASASS